MYTFSPPYLAVMLLLAVPAAQVHAHAPDVAPSPSPVAATTTPPPEDDTSTASAKDDSVPARQGNAFDIRIHAPSDVRKLLTQHLELRRYQKVSDLDAYELQRLLTMSEAHIRQLLATQGYFTPQVQQTMQPAKSKNDRAQVVIDIQPGERTRIATARVRLDGTIDTAASARQQHAQITRNWQELAGEHFTQDDWSTIKTETLKRLQARRFPAAKLVNSLADVDPDTAQAHLSAHYDSGPLYRYGALQIDGAQRYDPRIIERLVRLPHGQEYRQSDLLAAQKRLLESGYYNSAVVYMDTSPSSRPEAAPVQVQVQEARLHNLIFGIGMTTDRGPRASVDYTHNRIPWLGWRLTSKLQVDRKLQTAQAKLVAPPAEDMWSWMLAARISRERDDDVVINNRQVQWGRTKSADNIDRSYYLQYDYTSLRLDSGEHDLAQALSAHYRWTYRQFNHATYPTRGFGLGLQAGAGITIHPHQRLFTRLGARYMGFWSLDVPWNEGLLAALPTTEHMRQVLTNPTQTAQATAEAQATEQGGLLPAASTSSARRERGELVLRTEAAAVNAKKDAVIPANLLFFTGGDTSVRGYSYNELGVQSTSGLTVPGRYLFTASVEYRRPLFIRNRSTDWDIVAYIDTGNVADTPRGLHKLYTGIGAGVLWRSPVGPLQLSLAYGLNSQKARLHMNLGFTF